MNARRSWLAVLAVLAVLICCPERASAETFVIDFAGNIDGSDTIRVEANQATWTHNYYAWPGTVTFNGVNWQPSLLPHQLTFPDPLVPNGLSNYSVATNRTSGRDVAVAEIAGNQLLIHLNDTPNGGGLYEFEVVLTEKAPPVATPAATLNVRGGIDGSDRISITNTAATWIHKHFTTPSSIWMNDVAWNPASQPVLPNLGASRFLPDGIDLSTATFVKNDGRDVATFEVFSDRVELVFADSPIGGDFYDVTLTFGSVPEPSTFVLSILGAVGLLAYAGRKRRRGRAG